MGRKVFVGSLAWATDEVGLRDAFERFGTVTYAKVIVDRDTGRSRGFGFVEYSNDEEAQAAIAGMDQQQLDGRRINVNEAQEREDRGGSGGGRDRRDSAPKRHDNGGGHQATGYRTESGSAHWGGDSCGDSKPRRKGNSRRSPRDPYSDW